MRRVILALFAAALLTQSTACYGPFRLTLAIHKFNGDLGNDIVEEIVFLAMIIVPVYELAAIGDALIFNTLEYWTGKNLFGGGGTRRADATVPLDDGTELVLSDDGQGGVRLSHHGAVHRLVRTADGLALLDEQGVPLATARRTEDGGLEVTSRDRGTLRRGPEALAALEGMSAPAAVGWAAAQHAAP